MGAQEALPEASGPGSVVLDIGEDVGAAIITTPESLAGCELEIRAAGRAWDGRHVAVLERRLPSGPIWAGVFPALQEGVWEARIRDQPDGPSSTFTVAGGRATRAHLPG